MNIEILPVGSLGVNAYFLFDESGKTLIIDPGDNIDEINAFLQKRALTCVAVLLTHAHFDHAGCVKKLQDSGAKVYMHEADFILLNTPYNLAEAFGMTFDAFVPDELLRGGEILELLGERIGVLHTPGHTDGSVCYILGDKIFSGDTLFALSVGRTDFPFGSVVKLKSSLKRLFSLNGNYFVYPGHGESTDLDYERKYNPYA